MPDEIQQRIARVDPAGGTQPPAVHVRAIVIRPTTPLGKLVLTAVLIGAGVLFFTVGIALAVALAAAAAVTGLGVVAYRAVTGGKAIAPPERRLDPEGEIFLPRKTD